jgi:hypothetical protein
MMLNWKKAIQRTYLLGGRLRFPRTEAQETGSEATESPRSHRKQRTTEVAAIAHTRLSNVNTVYNQTQCSRYYIHRRSTTALLHHWNLYCAPSLIIVLFFVVNIFFFFFFLFVNFFSLQLVGVGHFVAPVVVVVVAAAFPPQSINRI